MGGVGRWSAAAGGGRVGAGPLCARRRALSRVEPFVVALKESMAEHRATDKPHLFAAAVDNPSPPIDDGHRDACSWYRFVGATMARNTVCRARLRFGKRRPRSTPVARHGTDSGMLIALLATTTRRRKRTRRPCRITTPRLWNNLGITGEYGDVYGAKAAWQSALGVNRTYCKAHANPGFMAQSRGPDREAVVEFTTTLSYEQPRRAHGLAHLRRRAAKSGERSPTKALLRLDPGFSRAEEVKQRLLELTW